jgi:hypothetical protein
MSSLSVSDEEVIEGTGAELAEQLRLPDRANRRFKAVSMPDVENQEISSKNSGPNTKALAALRTIADNQKNRAYSDGSNTQRLIREARSGAMYDCDPVE